MKQPSLKILIAGVRLSIAALVLVLLSLVFFSFTIENINEEFLKQLGIPKTEANSKITNSILGGYLDAYGAKNVKNIALGNRTAVTKDLLAYTKQYVNSDVFRTAYAAMKLQNKPQETKAPETPEEMRLNMIKAGKEYVAQAEEQLKNAAPEYKEVFRSSLDAAKKNLAQAEDPNNKNLKAYTQNYEGLKKSIENSNQQRLKEWEQQYPENHLLFVKKRLEDFMKETNDIDFSAQLTDRGGKKIFVNPVYEKKGNRWKMAFRAGKEVVEPAREFVQQWIDEIK